MISCTIYLYGLSTPMLYVLFVVVIVVVVVVVVVIYDCLEDICVHIL